MSIGVEAWLGLGIITTVPPVETIVMLFGSVIMVLFPRDSTDTPVPSSWLPKYQWDDLGSQVELVCWDLGR